MTSVISDITYANNRSKVILDNISAKNETKLYKLEGNIDDPMINTAWNAFGTYLSRNIRLGRAISIPKLGLITFSAPYVNLDGVTNPQQRDLRQRTPVLLISKEFVKGLSIREGIVVGGTVRAFSMKGVISGLPQIRANYTDIGYNAGMDKDTAKICVERVIKELAEKARLGKNVDMEIPNLGRFLIKNQTAAIEFDEFLVTDALDATNKLKDFRAKGESSALTGPNVRDFMYQTFQTPGSRFFEVEKPLKINESAQNWLKSTLNIDVNEFKPTNGRPQTSKSVSSHSAMSSPKRNQWRDTDSVCSSVASTVRSFRPATSKLINNSELLHEKSQFEIFQNGKKKIKKWVKEQSLMSEEAFLEIVRKTIGPNASPKAKLNFLEFKRGLHRIPSLGLEIEEIDAISKALDYDNQKTIDIEKWTKFFRNERSYVSYIQEVVAKYNLHNDDILRRMSLNKNSPAQTVHSLKEKLKALDPTIGDSEAQKTAQEILQGRDKIEVADLIKVIGSQTSTQEESNWYISQLMTLKKKVGNLLKLRDQFEKTDEKNAGLVDTTTFKAVISKYLPGLNNEDLKRFTRQVEKDTDMKIDYVNFVEVVEKVKTEDELQNLTQSPFYMALEQFNIINDKLQEYFNTHHVQPKDVIEKIYVNHASEQTENKKVLLDFFAEFLHQICKSSFLKKRSCRDFANRVDIDKDGFINETDLKTFMNRNSYIKESTKEALFNSGVEGPSNSKVFPKAALPEEKVEIILRDLRQTLSKKKISFYDFFQMIDVTRTGFVTINDFCTGIDKVMKLSKPIKDGFFAYIDRENIGIINYEDFVKVLKRSIVDKPSEVSEDNFDWQNQIINRIKDYTIEKKLSPEDTFRIIDCDFDGFISKNDLTQFLKEVLVTQSQEVTQPRVERLFKLMDIYKRGCIQLSDIKVILNNVNTKNNFILTAGSTLIEKASFDWILHARQQIGLTISRQFSSLKASFEAISEKNARMKFSQFKNWIENNRILSGFNMTEKLLQKLFADLDPHKKGYLSEVDWLNAFNGYNVQNQVLLEVQEALTTNYSDIENAFEFFISHESQINTEATEITYQGFQKAIEALLPRRFDNSDMNYLWNKCSADKNVITFRRFSTLFANKNFTGTSYGPIARNTLHPIISVRPKTSGASVFSVTNTITNHKLSKEEKQKKVFDKLRQILVSAGITVEGFFSKFDTDRSGDLSNLEFINAIKNLNLGLNLTEIEDLLVYCDSNQDGKISFHEFVRKFAPQNTQNRLFERAKNKLKRFKDNIYAYMLSPKDAFLNFNEDRTGRLSYDQFNKLVNRLCLLAKEEVPPFAIIKDMFDFIDIRRDGIIDMTEWMQSLRLIENDTIALDKTSTAVKRRSATTNVRNLTKTYGEGVSSSASKQKAESATLKKSLNVSTWECSQEYEKVLKIIGKHRKGLTTAFENLRQQGITIDAARVKETVGELLNSSGLKLDDDQWYYLYKFAEKDGVVDFKYMLEVFKERLYLLSAHPKKSTVDY